MTHVYVTTITDEAGNVVTGNFNNSDITSRSTSNSDGQYMGLKNPTLNFKDSHNIPLISLNPTDKKPIFGSPTELFSWFYYQSYKTYTIDGITPRRSDNSRNYLAPQGLVVDEDNGDIYVSFNLGDISSETAHGGPKRVMLSGVANEYINLMPIIKFNSSGVAQGIEYVIGGTHEGYMTLWKDSDTGKKYLGVAAYPHGVGTRNNDKKPDGFDDSWTPYYYIGNDDVTYYAFNVAGKFASNNRDSTQLLHASEYGGTGVVMVKKFDSTNLNTQQNSEIHVDPYRKIVQTAAAVVPNIFKFDPTKTAHDFDPIPYLNFQNGRQGSSNTYQSACIRGGHFYASYGSRTSSVGQAELRVSLINKGSITNNQSLVDYKVFTDIEIPNFYETEGMWVNEAETKAYFIVKYYYSTDNQQSTMRVFEVPLTW